MFLNRLWADWQKYLHFYLSGSVMVTIESQWYITETHCDQGTGSGFAYIFYAKRLIITSSKTPLLKTKFKSRSLVFYSGTVNVFTY